MVNSGMADLSGKFTIIERTIVEWLSASGFKVIHFEDEWVLEEVGEEMSVTSLACAIVQALERIK